MSELTFDDYAYHARGTSYFLHNPSDDEKLDTVYYGFNEESNELLTDAQYPTELTQALWGQEVDPDVMRALAWEKASEAGDLFYFIAASGMLKNIPLRTLGRRAFELYTGSETSSENLTFEQIDTALADKMSHSVSPDYSPNYFGMQFFGLPVFEFDATDDGLDNTRELVHGPLTLRADGRYCLERLARDFSERIGFPDERFDESYIREGALLLGGLSAVLQNRLGSSLSEAARLNMIKRERRAQQGTLLSGKDTERSRNESKERPRVGGWESTELNLLYSMPAQ